MLIPTDTGDIDIKLAWIEPDLLELNITETTGGSTHYHQPRYITPQDLSHLSDYINRTLCL